MSVSKVQKVEQPKEFEDLNECDFSRIPKFINTDDEALDLPIVDRQVQHQPEDQIIPEISDIPSPISPSRSIQSSSPSDSRRSDSPEKESRRIHHPDGESLNVSTFPIYALRPPRPKVYIDINKTTTECPCSYCVTMSNLDMYSDSLPVILNALVATASHSEHGEWRSFWIDYQDFFLELLAEGHSQLVRSLFRNLTYPIPIARDLIDLSQASYRAGRSDDSKSLRMEMSSLIDSMKTSVKVAEQETVSHYQNLSEFSNQVTRVSAELAASVAMIEKMVTQTSLRHVTVPLPQETITARGHSLT